MSSTLPYMTVKTIHTERFELRLPKADKKEFERAAQEMGVSLSDWMRLTLKRALKEEAKA
jgi:antitoxin component of RelBE/YafQ-DinJ toxin-antitoxin module